MRRVPAALVLVAAVILVVAVSAALRGSDDEPVLGTLLDRVVAAGAPGVLVVTRDGATVRSDARGFAGRGSACPAGSDTRFRVGSVTKTFVAALVLELAQDRKLGLDHSVERWLPGLVPAGCEITVRHLLAHRSGSSTTSSTHVSFAIRGGDGRRGSSSRSRSIARASARHRDGASPTRARTTSSSG